MFMTERVGEAAWNYTMQAMLTTADHRRDSAGLRYVYPVVSRRAGGVSVGINLNVNDACNWACLYCQVDGLRRGGPPPVDIALLERELAQFLDAAINGDFLARNAPLTARRLADVAFSGNGEPTSAAEFAAAVEAVGRVLADFGLSGELLLRLITNGSLLHRPAVAAGIRRLGELGGEVWFKLDRAQPEAMREINGVALTPARVAAHLARCAALASTWVQTCWFAVDGQAPDAAARAAYCALLAPLAGRLAGIHLYGLARPSRQPAAARLTALPAEELSFFANEVHEKTGIRVLVSP
jgi:wyosine [tRNA(Phe)-imidazoG37] synthetase (radical SAM superfamily)